MAEAADHYRTLEIAENASAAEIKRAYRGLVRACHPDRHAGDVALAERFRAVQEAYEVLSNPSSRLMYDRRRLDPLAPFRYASRAEPRRAAPRNTEVEVRLSFEEALAGGEAVARLPDGSDVAVRVPRGIRSGVKVRFKGLGARTASGGAASGEPRDLYVLFRVAPSPRFRREGHDLHIVEPVAVFDALLGTSRAIASAYGKKLTLTIPPGTQPGERLRLRGQGVATSTKTGDLYVEVQVTVPRALTDEQRAALAECAQQAGLL